MKKKQKSPLDVNDLFPGYFNKWIFRSVIFFMILFTLFVYVENGGQLKFDYIICPEETIKFCEYYPLNYTGNPYDQEPILMQPGETIGTPPSFFARNYNRICLLMVLFGFLSNHLFYFMRTKKFKIPVHKEKWNKLKENFKEAFNNANKN